MRFMPFTNVRTRVGRSSGGFSKWSLVIWMLVASVSADDFLYNFVTRKFELTVTSLAYDPVTQKVYASSPGNAPKDPKSILQIDPESGAVLTNIALTTSPGIIRADGAGGLWVALEGESAVSRIDLRSLTVGPKIVLAATSNILDIAPSPGDGNIVAVSRRLTNGTYSNLLISYGEVLPRQDAKGPQTIEFANEFVLFGSGTNLNRYVSGQDGLTLDTSAALDLGDFTPLGNRLYFTSGNVYEISSGKVLDRLFTNKVFTLSANPLENTIYTLSSNNATSARLQRYDLVTNRLDTLSTLTNVAANPRHLITWSQGRGAFHTDDALYLIDQQVILHFPPVLDITQISDPNPADAASNVVLEVAIKNSGTGAATNVVATVELVSPDELISARAFAGGTSAVAGSIATLNFKGIDIGKSARAEVTVRPSGFAQILTRVTVTAQSLVRVEMKVERKFETPVRIVRTNGLFTAALSSKDMAYDPTTGKLLIANGTGSNSLWFVHPETSRIDYLKSGEGQAKIAVSPKGGAAYLGGSNLPFPTIYPFVTTNGQELLKPYTAAGTLIDLAVSPANPLLLAVADSSGVYLKLNRIHLPRETTVPGPIEFSESGDRLYIRNTSTCSLNVYSNTPSGLILAETLTNAACRDFHIKDGLIFSDAGTVYDIAAQQMIAEIPDLGPQSLVAPEGNGVAVALSLRGTDWVLRRFRLFPFAMLGDLTVPAVQGLPGNLISWRAKSVAFRTSSQLFVANIPDTGANLDLDLTPEGRLALSFNSVVGRKYRIEKSDQLPAVSWTTVVEELEALESTTTQLLDLPASGHEFFRIVVTAP